jgi:Xaa-Pro aminopeptidase
MAARFQSFDETSDRAASGPRVAALRAQLGRQGLDGFIVPRADRYQNEYVPPSDERLAWISGFAGSAGSAVVLADRAALFVDGRYTLQVREQVDTDLFEIVHLTDTPLDQWIEKTLREGQKLGYDPWLHRRGCRRLPRPPAARARSWSRPSPTQSTPCGPTGRRRRSAPSRCTAAILRRAGRAQAPASAPSSSSRPTRSSCPTRAACWFNIRGSDVAHTPLALAVAIVPREDRASLYVDGRKLTNSVRDALGVLAELRSRPSRPTSRRSERRIARCARRGGPPMRSAASSARARRSPRRRSDRADEGDKNDTEIAGARAASARRRGGDALPRGSTARRRAAN